MGTAQAEAKWPSVGDVVGGSPSLNGRLCWIASKAISNPWDSIIQWSRA